VAIRLAGRRGLPVRHGKLRQNLDREALTHSAVLHGLADRDRTRTALRVADDEVKRPARQPLLADSIALVIVIFWAGRYGVAVVVLAADVDCHLVLHNDLVAVRVERVAGLDPQLAVRGARPDVEAADNPPAMKHAVVPARLLAKVELLLRQVGLAEQLAAEVAGPFDCHDERNLQRHSPRGDVPFKIRLEGPALVQSGAGVGGAGAG